MDFRFTDEQRMWHDTLHSFMEKEVGRDGRTYLETTGLVSLIGKTDECSSRSVSGPILRIRRLTRLCTFGPGVL